MYLEVGGLEPMFTRLFAKLAAKTAERLVGPDGLVQGDIWPLRTKLGAIPCVDGVAVRRNAAGEIEGGIIRRRTGKFPGKLALIGGVIARYESIEDALKRHWREDLGLLVYLPTGWSRPVRMQQYAPQVDGRNRLSFLHDPGKHSVASTHLVIIDPKSGPVTFGHKLGGQEAEDFVWLSKETCPGDTEWAYNMRETFLDCLTAAEALL